MLKVVTDKLMRYATALFVDDGCHLHGLRGGKE
jgi:hypothetical protein